MKTAVQRLTEWYSRRCNGDWEHSYGFTIDTLDNPGVSVSVDLRETELESVPFEEKKEDYESTDRWMICQRSANKFEGRGAPCRLEDIIEEFLRWAGLHQKEPNQSPQRNAGSRPSSGDSSATEIPFSLGPRG